MSRERVDPGPAIEPLLERRWSPRAFTEREPTDEQLTLLFEAARWMPSAGNSQPWRFVVGRRGAGDGTHAAIAATLTGNNTRWAPLAPVLAVSIARLHNEKRALVTGLYDTGMAVGGLLVQATAMGLAVHQMGGFDRDAVREAFAVPEQFMPVAAIAIGYEATPDQLPDDLREREVQPRTRLGLDEVVFGRRFGVSAGIGDAG